MTTFAVVCIMTAIVGVLSGVYMLKNKRFPRDLRIDVPFAIVEFLLAAFLVVLAVVGLS